MSSPVVPLRREARAAVRWSPALRAKATGPAATGPAATGPAATGELDLVDVSPFGAGLRDPALAVDWQVGDVLALQLALGTAAHARTGRIVWRRDEADGRRFGVRFEPAGSASPPLLLDLDGVRPDPRYALRLPAAQAMRRRMLPLCQLQAHVVVACADLTDSAGLAAVARLFDLPLRPQAVDGEQLQRLLRAVHGEARATSEAAADDPVALCNEVLHAAFLQRASDVHLCPERDGLLVRLRVDGQLEDYRRLGKDVQSELLSRIKVLAGMDIAEKRAPQDGRFTHEVAPGRRFDVRVATLPTNHGERATLRLLAIEVDTLTLDGLGLLADDFALCQKQLQRPHGLIVATGPTGCGKTTTLFAMLRTIVAARKVNVIAVQEPVEVDFPGISQVEVDAGRKVSFATALRSIMRHDPDVIMIGEIRDLETAGIAVKAALTGHLVLATLHTNDAASTVTRLVDMGVERYLLASTLRLVLAQRLVRRLCPHCRAPQPLDGDTAPGLRRPDLVGSRVFAPVGCVACAGVGHRGRTGLFELLPVDAALAAAIRGGADEEQLRTLAAAAGCARLRDDAVHKLQRGDTGCVQVVEALAD
jgi:type IV pilus assembly protein PilB